MSLRTSAHTGVAIRPPYPEKRIATVASLPRNDIVLLTHQYLVSCIYSYPYLIYLEVVIWYVTRMKTAASM